MLGLHLQEATITILICDLVGIIHEHLLLAIAHVNTDRICARIIGVMFDLSENLLSAQAYHSLTMRSSILLDGLLTYDEQYVQCDQRCQ